MTTYPDTHRDESSDSQDGERPALDRDWWSEFTAVPDEFLDAGDEVVVLGRYRGTAKQTGKQLDVPFVHVWSLRDGKAWRFRQFLDTDGWVEALSDDG